jgi:hypothetical protein
MDNITLDKLDLVLEYLLFDLTDIVGEYLTGLSDHVYLGSHISYADDYYDHHDGQTYSKGTGIISAIEDNTWDPTLGKYKLKVKNDRSGLHMTVYQIENTFPYEGPPN